jgi:hypothetical protein
MKLILFYVIFVLFTGLPGGWQFAPPDPSDFCRTESKFETAVMETTQSVPNQGGCHN